MGPLWPIDAKEGKVDASVFGKVSCVFKEENRSLVGHGRKKSKGGREKTDSETKISILKLDIVF